MENNIKMVYNISRNEAQLKKNLKFISSSNKYKVAFPLIKQKQNIMRTQEQNDSKINLKNLRERFKEFTPENREKELVSITLSTVSNDWRTNHRGSFSAQRYHNFFSSAPKKYYLNKGKNISHYIPIPLIFSYNKKSGFNTEKGRKNKIADIHSSFFKSTYRSKSRSNLRLTYNNNINSKGSFLQIEGVNYFVSNKSYNSEIIRKEISSLSKILKNNQNKELRQRGTEFRYKTNDLVNSIKSLNIDNQRVGSVKKKLWMKINNPENELDNNKTISINELENKNIIAQLNEEIFHLNNLLGEKDKIIIDLLNNLHNNNDKFENEGNYINEGYKKRKKIYNKTEENNDDINYGYKEELRRINNNELINEINYREQIKNLKYERENTERENKIMNNNLIDNKKKLTKINNRIEKYENSRKKNKKLENETKQKIKNYMPHLSEKIFFEKEQNEYGNNINDLTQKLNLLKNKNNNLDYSINNNRNKYLPQNKNIDYNENIINQLLVQFDKLIEENNILKAHLNEQGQKLNNNSNKGSNIGKSFQLISNLKNDLKKKISEIKNLKEKLKNLFNNLNSFKNKNEELMKNISQLKQEINQLNIKVNKLKNDNFKKQQQIIDLSNFNSKLLIQINSAYSDYFQQTINNYDINHNEESKKHIALFERKNEELQNKLMNNLNRRENINDKINQIKLEKNNLIKENSNLKEEILSLKTLINELKNINNNNPLQLQRIDELERQLEEAKNECELNLKELKIKQSENQKLLNIIKNKEIENAKLQNELDNNYRGSEDRTLSMGDNIDIHFNQNIEGKNMQTDILKKINYYRTNNDKLFQENSSLKQKMDIIQNEQEETIHNLKNEIKDKSLQIKKLIKENNYLKNNENNNNEDEKKIDLNNNNEIDLFRNLSYSTNIYDANRIKLYKEEIKNYKMENESHKIQIKTLKEEIKIIKTKIKNLESFGGQMKNIDEFISLLNKALVNYNPIKKEQKVALNKIMEILNNNQK